MTFSASQLTYYGIIQTFSADRLSEAKTEYKLRLFLSETDQLPYLMFSTLLCSDATSTYQKNQYGGAQSIALLQAHGRSPLFYKPPRLQQEVMAINWHNRDRESTEP